MQEPARFHVRVVFNRYFYPEGAVRFDLPDLNSILEKELSVPGVVLKRDGQVDINGVQAPEESFVAAISVTNIPAEALLLAALPVRSRIILRDFEHKMTLSDKTRTVIERVPSALSLELELKKVLRVTLADIK